ncbi:MAG: hypothetical protein JJ850_02280 [Kordiimonadaceae bacterium]|nr:hypothetical protein [Kordiimonadaceae bacterium]MBO6567368.1 hypothetical protein [Kordiimonadaceae bacterium]MBO6963418.1 hypothetical protein [Kordiimonadaceae bacterium]
MKRSKIFTALVAMAASTGAMAQGQDSTPGERNLLVLSELLPGIYSSANQALFDARRGIVEAERHGREEFQIERLEAPHSFSLVGTFAGKESSYQMSLVPGPTDQELTAKLANGEGATIEDCEIRFKRRAEHYDGAAVGSGCDSLGFTGMQVSRKEVWVEVASKAEPYWYERAREFHCYADLPGVSGGRDIPFERYDNITLHDKGKTHWFTTRGEEKREIGLTLQAITWHVLNENNGNFNRNSLVLYASERMPDGSTKSHPYTFTEPSAERLGYNLRWMLVNCAITPRDKARPEM